jgi:hypothetical protein
MHGLAAILRDASLSLSSGRAARGLGGDAPQDDVCKSTTVL